MAGETEAPGSRRLLLFRIKARAGGVLEADVVPVPLGARVRQWRICRTFYALRRVVRRMNAGRAGYQPG